MEEQKDKKDKKVRKDKRLSSKINSRFIALTLIAILCTMILSTTVYYDLFKKEIMRDLENYTQTLKSAGLFDDISELRNVRTFMFSVCRWKLFNIKNNFTAC